MLLNQRMAEMETKVLALTNKLSEVRVVPINSSVDSDPQSETNEVCYIDLLESIFTNT